MDITRTELVWPGKYDETGERVAPPRVALPFQTIETINESRATRARLRKPEQISLFDVWTGDEGDTFEDGWRNKLIWGDNLLAISSLLKSQAGKIDLIYIDPPFATGADFHIEALVGDDVATVTKAPSSIEEKAYRDTWGAGSASYLAMMLPRLELMRDLLSERGSIFVHCDWHVNYQLRMLMDEVFGPGNFVNEIVWYYYNKYSAATRCLPRAHDTILYYSKSGNHILNEFRVQRDVAAKQLVRENVGGVLRNARDEAGKLMYRIVDDKKGDDVWAIPQLQPASAEWTGYETQKHHDLLERIIQIGSERGSLIADFFVGSGTTAAVAEKLGRRWIASDLGRFAVHTTRKRLMGIEGCKPFEVLNLGKYERQYWQASSFAGRDAQQVLFEYIAFMLRLYGAEPLAGLQHLHGKRSGAVVHVGAVDAPVTIAEVTDALDECVATGQRELHVLGWEWEMGLNDLVKQLGADRGVDLKLRQVPREVMEVQAVEKGDIRFFELAYLDCKLETDSQRSTTVELTDFAMSDADAIDPDVRAKITKWSDFVDYWAVDFDFQNDTFINGWVAYRTRKDRHLSLRSDSHLYANPGTYNVAVKVVDIFGNDTTRVFPVEVR